MDPALANLIQTIMTGGPPAIAVIFATLWWLERAERKNLGEKLIKTLENMSDMNEAWLKVLRGGGATK